MSDRAIYIIGWVTLAPIGVAAVTIIYRMIVPQWRRIWSLACGNPEPLYPAASVAFPHRPRRNQLRAVEADVELTRETIDG